MTATARPLFEVLDEHVAKVAAARAEAAERAHMEAHVPGVAELGRRLAAEQRDQNGTYVVGTYSDGREVHVYGTRGGFAYIAFTADLGWVTKVPEGWVR